MTTNFDPREHQYIEHPTYTGEGCAVCSHNEFEHENAFVECIAFTG